MVLRFHKYQGTGNDFIMVDQRDIKYIHHFETQLIKTLCDRRFGIGADGLILLENSPGNDFRMVYFNADGHEGSMCGNGGRCILAFARTLGIFDKATTFDAVDGVHSGKVQSDGTIGMQMRDVNEIISIDKNTHELNTGSPHYVIYLNNLPVNVKLEGANIRYSDKYKKEGINVNFVVEKSVNKLEAATYERGVEDETYSCGTGVTAIALSYAYKHNLLGKNEIFIDMKGGELRVTFVREGMENFTDIWLSGPAEKVFEGTFSLNAKLA